MKNTRDVKTHIKMAKKVTVTTLLMSVIAVCVQGQGLIPGIPNQCFEPAETGVCRAFVPAFYFNPLTGACDCFVYGGCRGNNNRFSTLEECSKTCSVQPERQFNTPSCDRIFRESNPLAQFLDAPQQAVNPSQIRQPTSQGQAQQQTQTTFRPQTQAPAQKPTQAPAQIQTQAPIQVQSQAPSQIQTQSPAQPQRITVQPVQPVILLDVSNRGQQQIQGPVKESVFSTNGDKTGIKTINSIIIGSTGVRPGTITIGQPVSIIVLRPQQIQSRTKQAASGSELDSEGQSESESQSNGDSHFAAESQQVSQFTADEEQEE